MPTTESNPQIPPEPRFGPPLAICDFFVKKAQKIVSDLAGFWESGDVKNTAPPDFPEFGKL
jgi:hypothetical protein